MQGGISSGPSEVTLSNEFSSTSATEVVLSNFDSNSFFILNNSIFSNDINFHLLIKIKVIITLMIMLTRLRLM